MRDEMAPCVVQQLMISMLVLTLPRPSSSCQTRDTPLLLSPYLDSNQVDTARNLSKVDRGCVEDFVPDSFTGFLTVDKELGNHLFFWFFPSTEDENAPLLLWLNGGPTISSTIGLFWENGPMELITEEEQPNTDCEQKCQDASRGYRKRKYSWAGPFSMLYVDNPVDTGFSFSDSGEKGQRGTQEGYTKDLVAFMKEFMRLFPEYKTRELYLGGQSYAGKYIPSLAHEIHTLIQAGQVDFNLTGIYLVAPWFDPEVQEEAFFDYLYNMGVISFKSLQVAKKKARDFFTKSRSEQTYNMTTIEYLKDNHLFFHLAESLYNYDNSKSVLSFHDFADFMSKSDIKGAAHVGKKSFKKPSIDHTAYTKLQNDILLVSTKTKLGELMNFYKVLIVNGDYDVIVNTNMIEQSLFTTPWKFQAEYKDEVRSTWRRDGREVIGYYSLTDRFCRVVIHGAGHQAPHDTPEVALTMMKQFIKYGCVRDYNQTADSDTNYREPSSVSSSLSSCTIALRIVGITLLTVTLLQRNILVSF